jgi:hypothetical protein
MLKKKQTIPNHLPLIIIFANQKQSLLHPGHEKAIKYFIWSK